MTRAEFIAIIADIERHMEGDAYALRVHTRAGCTFQGGWSWLDNHPQTPWLNEIIVLSNADQPPLYVPLSAVESLQLSAR
jgi:hypothetical protein